MIQRMSYHKAIEQALEHAPVVRVDPDATLLPFEHQEIGADLSGESDNLPIHCNPGDLQREPNEVIAHSARASELRALIRAYYEVGDWEAPLDYIETNVQHECEHLRAAQLLDARDTYFGITLSRVDTGQETGTAYRPWLRNINFVTTRLGAALIAGYPIEPTEGDKWDVQDMGYRSIDEIAQKALARNAARRKRSDMYYPVPLSYRR